MTRLPTQKPLESVGWLGGTSYRVVIHEEERKRVMGAQDPGVIASRRMHLTPREIETLSLLATGHTYKETGALLFISPKTVETNVANARGALGAKNTNHLIAMFVRKFQGTASQYQNVSTTRVPPNATKPPETGS